MKTLKTLILVLALSAACFAQATLSSTTLGAAITSASATTITLASTSTMLSAGPANQVNTVIYVDKEYMRVTTVIDSTHLLVQRHAGVGWGGRSATHASGATVYFANTVGSIPADSYFSNGSTNSEATGSCTATSELALPKIYVFSSNAYDCLGGQWVQTNSPGRPVLGSTVTMPAGVATATGTIFLTDTGTAATTGLNVPKGWAPGMCLIIIPGGAFTTTTATNIRIATTAVVGKALTMCWDGSKWDPSY